jgi:RHS repeat-associated protein
VKIVEKTNGSVTSTKQFVWCPGEAQPSEERDGSNAVTKRYCPQGVKVGTTNYYYTKDHLGSIREITDSSGAIQARYDYDPYGRRTKLTGSLDADFGFTGHYHQSSGLSLALYRAYDADLGRWVNRDPVGEYGGLNLYGYVRNNPLNWVDPFGLAAIYTDQTNGRTYFNPNPESPGPIVSWDSRSSVKPDSLPGAAGPYDSANVYPTRGPYRDNANAYGPNDILRTDDDRGRWLHGGGSDLDDPLAPRQGWESTHGCTRLQNEDIEDLVNRVRDFRRDNPGVPIPDSRSAPPVGDFPNLFPGVAIS